MIAKPKSQVALVLFNPLDHQVLVDLEPINRDCCEIFQFGTSVMIENGDIIWNKTEKGPQDVVVLIDNRPQATNIHSVLKGSSGEIERYNIQYSNTGILAIFYLRKQPVTHPVFTQAWRFTYYLHKRRVVVNSHPIDGVEVHTY